MVLSRYSQLDTPALLVDDTIVRSNILTMQEKTNKYGVRLMPINLVCRLSTWAASRHWAVLSAARCPLLQERPSSVLRLPASVRWNLQSATRREC